MLHITFNFFLFALGRAYTVYCPKPHQKTSVRTSASTVWILPHVTPTLALTSSSPAKWVWEPTNRRCHLCLHLCFIVHNRFKVSQGLTSQRSYKFEHFCSCVYLTILYSFVHVIQYIWNFMCCNYVYVAGEALLWHGGVQGNAHWNRECDQLVNAQVGQEWFVSFYILKKEKCFSSGARHSLMCWLISVGFLLQSLLL